MKLLPYSILIAFLCTVPAFANVTITLVEQAPSSQIVPPPVPRILGLDHGARRIGVAISDELGLTAQPLLTIVHTNPRNDLRSLGRLLRRYTCAEIVLGWPIHLSGDRSPRAIAAEKFADSLRAEFRTRFCEK